jgi:arylamine N-acetyltransferase
MHPARLSFLAWNHAQRRAVVATDQRTDGTTFTLECGHTSEMAPHFDARQVQERSCHRCGAEYVKTAPQYASEFAAEDEKPPREEWPSVMDAAETPFAENH